MTWLHPRFATTSALLLPFSLFLSAGLQVQAPAVPATPHELVFEALPSKQLLARGEAIVLVLRIRNLSEAPIFVSRLRTR